MNAPRLTLHRGYWCECWTQSPTTGSRPALLASIEADTSRQAIGQLAQNLFAKGAVEKVIVAGLPKSRAAMHLDTVFSFCDRDLVTVFPEVVKEIVPFIIRPDESKPYGMDVRRENKSFIEVVGEQLGVKLRVVETGLKAGDKVVVGGMQRVQPGDLVAPTAIETDDTGRLAAGEAGTPAATAAPASHQS